MSSVIRQFENGVKLLAEGAFTESQGNDEDAFEIAKALERVARYWREQASPPQPNLREKDDEERHN